jgi:hypothetical protein
MSKAHARLLERGDCRGRLAVVATVKEEADG